MDGTTLTNFSSTRDLPLSTDAIVARLTAELRSSEARFRAIIEHNADAIVVIGVEGFILFANNAAARLFGQTREELLGRPFGFPVVAGETVELDLIRHGAGVVVEMRVVESEWEGQIACIASLRDITERKRAEQDARRLIQEQAARAAAEESAGRFRLLAESSAVLTSSLDFASTLSALPRLFVGTLADWAVVYELEDGHLRRLDAAHRDPAKADLIDALRVHPVGPEGLQPVLEVLRSRKPMLVEDVSPDWLGHNAQDPRHLELLRALRIESLMILPLFARDRAYGAIKLVSADTGRRFNKEDLALAQDIASRAALALDNARLYQEAQKANQSKSHFLAVISHDLRTPLNSILGYSELLTMGIPDKLADGSRQHVERVRTSAAHLLYLIDELLAYARLESRNEEVHAADVDVRDIVQQVSEVMQPLAAERNLRFEANLPESTMISTDPDKLRQVLLNLVSNAVKYTKHGEVELQTATEKGRILFRVRDTGVGIAQENLEQIFEPFWQVDVTQRSHANGTGLGLSVVKVLLLLLGGQITVESVLGKGTTFTVSLPRKPIGVKH
jgi:signal transduction histidine kinase